jgi:hypothetical protein
MGIDPKALVRSFVVVAVLAAGAFGLPARAQSRDTGAASRVAILPVPPEAAGTATLRLPFPATHVGLRWRGSEDDAVEIRWRQPGGWAPWRSLPIWDDAGDPDVGLVASGLIRAGSGATRLMVRWPSNATRLEMVAIDAGRDRALPPAATPLGADLGPRPRPVAGGSPAAQPEVISRYTWGADERMRKGHPEFAPISKLVVHHTVTENNDPDPAQTVRAIYAYHTRGNGWNDIGYNFLVDQQGRIYEGRFARKYRQGEVPTGEDEAGRGVIGAHAKAVNPGTAGVALLGDFSGGFAPPAPAVDALVRLLAWKAGRHDIDPQGATPFTAADGSRRTFPNIAGHRDVGQSGCPGGQLYERLPEIRQRVADGTGAAAAPSPPAPAPPAPPVPVPDFPGFWSAGSDGRIQAFGDARSAGDLGGQKLGGPIVSLAATPSGQGYWMVGADGGVFAFGDAPFLGAPVGQLRSPAVHIEPTPSGRGYWVLSAGGEVVPFGDAAFRGQVFPLPLTAVGLAATPSGQGYWLATVDSHVFAFGDAVLQAATGGTLAATATATATAAGPAPPSAPVVAIAASPDGHGYWLLARDGGIFSFGVPFHGSVPDRQPYGQAVELRASESGAGYYVAGGDGAVFAFGDADGRRQRPAGGPGGVIDVAFRPLGAPARVAATPAPAPPPRRPSRAGPESGPARHLTIR